MFCFFFVSACDIWLLQFELVLFFFFFLQHLHDLIFLFSFFVILIKFLFLQNTEIGTASTKSVNHFFVDSKLSWAESSHVRCCWVLRASFTVFGIWINTVHVNQHRANSNLAGKRSTLNLQLLNFRRNSICIANLLFNSFC